MMEHLAEKAQVPRDVCVWRRPPAHTGINLHRVASGALGKGLWAVDAARGAPQCQ